jgi:hypothetical protein
METVLMLALYIQLHLFFQKSFAKGLLNEILESCGRGGFLVLFRPCSAHPLQAAPKHKKNRPSLSQGSREKQTI